MTPVADIRELLPLYALGILDPDERAAVERAVAADPDLAMSLAAYRGTARQLVEPLLEAAVDAIAPVPPAPDVRARLLASAGAGPFERFARQLSALYEVTLDRAREILGLIERAASWEPQIPGIALVHFDGGPAYRAADCGFIRMAPGAVFPPHSHVGDEAVVILAGEVRDATHGRVLRAGDEYLQIAGSEHYLVNDGPVDCIFAARAMHGITIAGAPMRPQRSR
jgi:putative transcriptional regulator